MRWARAHAKAEAHSCGVKMHQIEVECFDDRADLPVAKLANVEVVAAEAYPRNMSLADCISHRP